MRPLKPAQAGFPPASRDFRRQAASGNTLAHKVRRSDARNSYATRCAQSLSETLEPFRLWRDRRARRRVIRIGSKTWKSDGLVYGRAGCALKPAQAGFPPASRDFSRQAASGNTLAHKVRRSDARNSHATRCAQSLSEKLEPFRLRRDRRARRRVIRIGSK